MSRYTFYIGGKNKILAYDGEYINSKKKKIYVKRVNRATFLVLENKNDEFILELKEMIKYMVNMVNSSTNIIITSLSKSDVGMILKLCNKNLDNVKINGETLQSSNFETYEGLEKNFDAEKLVDILNHDQLEELMDLIPSKLTSYRMLSNMFVYMKGNDLGICYYDYYTLCPGDTDCEEHNLLDVETKLPVKPESVFGFSAYEGGLQEYSNLEDYLIKNEIDFEDRMYQEKELSQLLNLLNKNISSRERKLKK